MSTYITSDALGRYDLATIQGVYPWCTAIWLSCGADEYSRQHVPPHSVRVRSRGKHSPGDGPYFCSHITMPLELNGFRRGSEIFATHLNIETHITRYETQWTRFAQGLCVIEYYHARTGYYYFKEYYNPTRTSESGMLWTGAMWSSTGHPHDYDAAKAEAFIAEPRSITWGWGRRQVADLPELGRPKFEDRGVADQVELGTNNFHIYRNEAMIDAFNSLPAIKTNNIANLLAIYSFLKSLLRLGADGKLLDGAGSLQDAWLGYRYAYSTTKADILELSSYVDRMRNLKHTKEVTGHGYYRYDSPADGTYIFKCALQVHKDDYLGIYNMAEKYGLALDAYNVWDLIPYSFIVDWFLHIGDMLEKARSKNYLMRLPSSVAWTSMTHTFTNHDGCTQCDYYRTSHAVNMETMPVSLLGHGSAGSTTWVKRATDAVCILTK